MRCTWKLKIVCDMCVEEIKEDTEVGKYRSVKSRCSWKLKTVCDMCTEGTDRHRGNTELHHRAADTEAAPFEWRRDIGPAEDFENTDMHTKGK